MTVQVLSGETADQLSSTLYADGVVASTRAFVLAAENSSYLTGLEPGYFTLNHHMQASLAWAALLNPKNRVQSVVTIPEGKRAVQVIATLAQVTKIPLKDFQQVIDHPAQLGLPSYADGKVEGFLFPATYTIVAARDRAADPAGDGGPLQRRGAADRPAGRRREDPPLRTRRHHRGVHGPGRGRLRLRLPEDRPGDHQPAQHPHAAAVRQRAAVRAQQVRGQRDRRADRHPGPVQRLRARRRAAGPISNPGNAAIQGILHPATGDWLYFLTVTGGNAPQFYAAIRPLNPGQ